MIKLFSAVAYLVPAMGVSAIIGGSVLNNQNNAKHLNNVSNSSDSNDGLFNGLERDAQQQALDQLQINKIQSKVQKIVNELFVLKGKKAPKTIQLNELQESFDVVINHIKEWKVEIAQEDKNIKDYLDRNVEQQIKEIVADLQKLSNEEKKLKQTEVTTNVELRRHKEMWSNMHKKMSKISDAIVYVHADLNHTNDALDEWNNNSIDSDGVNKLFTKISNGEKENGMLEQELTETIAKFKESQIKIDEKTTELNGVREDMKILVEKQNVQIKAWHQLIGESQRYQMWIQERPHLDMQLQHSEQVSEELGQRLSAAKVEMSGIDYLIDIKEREYRILKQQADLQISLLDINSPR